VPSPERAVGDSLAVFQLVGPISHWQLLLMTWVKICGMTNLEDALVAVEAGADAVGFVFYEKSPRCVSVETARDIVEKLPERCGEGGSVCRRDGGKSI
jgi:hypothetical protein